MKTLEQIALEVADSVQFSTTKPFTCDQIEEFARRLVAALGSHEPVAWMRFDELNELCTTIHPLSKFQKEYWKWTPLYAAPVVPDGWQLVGYLDGRKRFFYADDPLMQRDHAGMVECYAAAPEYKP